ncbi:unnamed protein product [Calypogeia fissa]
MVRRCQDDADWQRKSSGVMFPGRRSRSRLVTDGTLERKGVPVPQIPPSSAPARQERPQRWGLGFVFCTSGSYLRFIQLGYYVKHVAWI